MALLLHLQGSRSASLHVLALLGVSIALFFSMRWYVRARLVIQDESGH